MWLRDVTDSPVILLSIVPDIASQSFYFSCISLIIFLTKNLSNTFYPIDLVLTMTVLSLTQRCPEQRLELSMTVRSALLWTTFSLTQRCPEQRSELSNGSMFSAALDNIQLDSALSQQDSFDGL